MYLLRSSRGALRAPVEVRVKVRSAEAAAEAATAELATSRACYMDTPFEGLRIISGGLRLFRASE